MPWISHSTCCSRLGASGALVAHRRYHEFLALAGTFAIGAYIALLFMHLGAAGAA